MSSAIAGALAGLLGAQALATLSLAHAQLVAKQRSQSHQAT